MKVVLDTNILIDYLQGVSKARGEIGLHEQRSISIISWMEVLVGARDEHEDLALRRFLAGFRVEPITQEIADRAVEIRREHRIRLPDALIWATAIVGDAILVTRNSNDFPRKHPGIRIPYSL